MLNTISFLNNSWKGNGSKVFQSTYEEKKSSAMKFPTTIQLMILSYRTKILTNFFVQYQLFFFFYRTKTTTSESD